MLSASAAAEKSKHLPTVTQIPILDSTKIPIQSGDSSTSLRYGRNDALIKNRHVERSAAKSKHLPTVRAILILHTMKIPI